jgi:hypothetical protein
MKRISFIFFFTLLISEIASAQNRLGFVAGGIYSESNLKNQIQVTKERITRDPILGKWTVLNGSLKNTIIYSGVFSGYGGLVYDFKITNTFYIKSKLLFANKGWIEENDSRTDSLFFLSQSEIPDYRYIPDERTKSEQIYSIRYLELPVSFTFYAPVRKSLIFVGIGPYVSIGIAGKYRYRVKESNKQNRLDSTQNSKIGFNSNSSKELSARKFDYGAALDFGLELRNRIFITLTYSAGLVNVFENRYWALQNRNRDIRIGLGYYLKHKPQRGY